ncbi:Endonuclease/exonuclease/phosphatase [Fimicolochytrium jonesii]|uniref:Endonuclease/exonuclease/phosphatase n=1 Tax=Fimicolochytrium jonesii TaxID=1396493 RepID=UPI0022FE7035|nr:Endonuclease/exonuclease/phosphatase [Fimicolochytrium jonesii]KAI8825910.1 Endonuclease/exonuclease/phosphatase [Fimicolochytrium jonesii]
MKLSITATLASLLALASHSTAAPAPSAAVSGTFSLLTLNVAGLPAIISSGNPSKNTAAMGQRIRNWDHVHVQEDFNYHATLYANDNHPYRTATSGGVPFGSGLNTVSKYNWEKFQRIKWSKCYINEADCLTPKGFTFMRLKLTPTAAIDVYNLHMDAGSQPGDITARNSNFAQVTSFITANSAGNAVIVMGDTNSRYTRAGETISQFTKSNNLTDAWVQHARGGVAPPVGDAVVCGTVPAAECEVVDKILYRSGDKVTLNARSFAYRYNEFLDAEGKMLSDHFPLEAVIEYTVAA